MKNISQINWKAELKKITNSKGVDALKLEITPYRDWRIVVAVFFLGLLSSFAFNVYMSIEINRDSFFTTLPKSTGVVRFNEQGLAKVVAGLDEKAAVFEKAVTEGVAMIDPSL
ncbi:MAG: hypothetical protein Q7K40_02585 [bacterium]|nr:hypothetical protein [bacterium]